MFRTWCRGLVAAVICSTTPASADCSVFAPPASATIPRPGIASKISTANCMAEEKLNALHLAPDDASINAVNDATKASFDMFEAAIQAGDATLTPIAQQAKADLYQSMVVRMRASAAPMTMEKFAQATADHAAIESKIKPWLGKASAK